NPFSAKPPQEFEDRRGEGQVHVRPSFFTLLQSKKKQGELHLDVIILQRRLTIPLALIGLTAFPAAADDTMTSGRTLIRAGHVLNVHNGSEIADQTIIVTGDLISAISATSATPKQPN